MDNLSPKCFMITGLTKKGLLTEYAFLALENKDLMQLIICYSLPVVAHEFKRGNMSVIDISRHDITTALDSLYKLKKDLREDGNLTVNKLINTFSVTTDYRNQRPGFFIDYANNVRVFLETAYSNSFSNELEIIAR